MSATLLAAIAGPAASPAAAEPAARPGIPDVGARPAPSGPLRLPGDAPAAPPVAPGRLSPLGLRVTQAEIDVAALGERLKSIAAERTRAHSELVLADRAWRDATERLREVRLQADRAAAEAYKAAAGLPPGVVGSELTGLGALGPRLRAENLGSREAAARELLRAEATESATHTAYRAALAAERELGSSFTGLQTTFRSRQAALLRLRQQHADELAAIEIAREAQEQVLGPAFLGGPVNGYQAHSRALRAVRYALAQRGDPYLWAAEGPDRFDCSGLMWAAYRSVGVYLPRVAKDQYYATRSRSVSTASLLPGDLVFFSTDRSDWRAIHHVGMYIGNGRMVHAPTSGDVVKVSTVMWSRFFAATRPIGAVTARPKLDVPGPSVPGRPATPTRPTPEPTEPPPTTSPSPSDPPTSPPPPTPPPTTPPTEPPPTEPLPTEPPPTEPPPTTPPPGTEPPEVEPPPPPAEPDPPPPPEEPSPPTDPEGSDQPAATDPTGTP